jgi:hypothetical protein
VRCKEEFGAVSSGDGTSLFSAWGVVSDTLSRFSVGVEEFSGWAYSLILSEGFDGFDKTLPKSVTGLLVTGSITVGGNVPFHLAFLFCPRVILSNGSL